MVRNKDEDSVLFDIVVEYDNAVSKFGAFNSPHEGFAIIKEEVDELWDDIKANKGRTEDAYNEAKQIAAMAMRYMVEFKPELINHGE